MVLRSSSRSSIRFPLRSLLILSALLLVAGGCSSARLADPDTINEKGEPIPKLTVVVYGPIVGEVVRGSLAPKPWRYTFDVVVRNPSTIPIQIDRLIILLKDDRGEVRSAQESDAEWLKAIWKDSRIEPLSSRRIPLVFLADLYPDRPERSAVEVWVEGEDPEGKQIRAQGVLTGQFMKKGEGGF